MCSVQLSGCGGVRKKQILAGQQRPLASLIAMEKAVHARKKMENPGVVSMFKLIEKK
jgi:hypothetical protein